MGWGDITPEHVEARAARELASILVGRIGRVEEIAHVMCMIANPRASYMTGGDVRVDNWSVN